MKRLIIIVEGHSEEAFVNKILKPFFYSKGIFHIDCFKIKHSKGGLTKYAHLKKDILNCIYDSNTIITTLIDYYAIPSDFPSFNESLRIVNKNERLTFLENAVITEIETSKEISANHLIPYIQLHEFEALVFSSPKGINNLFEPNEINSREIENIFQAFNNPEEINDSAETAPSKRLKKYIKGYNKVIDGIMIIEEIGLETILVKCPRFKNWMDQIVKSVSE